MDVQMPEMDGVQATKAIRDPASKVLNPDIPIIAQTSYALISEKDQYGDIFDDYITKPLKMDEVLRIISKYIP